MQPSTQRAEAVPAPASPPGSSPIQANTLRGDFSPYVFVRHQVNRGGAPYTAPARHLALVLCDHLRADDRGDYVAWPAYITLAAETGLSVSTVRRAVRELADSKRPLIAIQRGRPVERAGRKYDQHRSLTYTLVLHPERFAAQRDAARAKKLDAAQALEERRHAERVRLQAARSLGTITELEYKRAMRELEKATWGKVPRHARKRKPATVHLGPALRKKAADGKQEQPAQRALLPAVGVHECKCGAVISYTAGGQRVNYPDGEPHECRK